MSPTHYLKTTTYSLLISQCSQSDSKHRKRSIPARDFHFILNKKKVWAVKNSGKLPIYVSSWIKVDRFDVLSPSLWMPIEHETVTVTVNQMQRIDGTLCQNHLISPVHSAKMKAQRSVQQMRMR